jgi:DNA-binding response OmpR family regulator
MLPGLDGFAVCERLLADPATAEIPVVFLTARAQAEDQLHGLEMGALDYITKPFNPLDLPGIVAVALARSRKAVRGRWQSEREEKLRSLIRLREASAI